MVRHGRPASRWQVLPATLALALAVSASPLPAAAPAGPTEASPERISERVARNPRVALHEARDHLNRARTSFRAGEYPRALEQVDRTIAICNAIVVGTKSAALRKSTASVFRSAAGLRLSVSTRLARARDRHPLIGPPVPRSLGLAPLAEAAPSLSEPTRVSIEEEAVFEAPADGAIEPIGEEIEEPIEPLELLPEDAQDDGIEGDEEFEVTEVSAEELSKPRFAGDLSPGPDREALRDANARLDRDPLPGVPLTMNAKVQKWIDYYTGRGRPYYERYLHRSGHYVEWMQELLEAEGLPPEIVYLVIVESGFNNHAVSRSWAVGQWQFIRGTAKLFDLEMNTWIDERRDPERATIAAARYLRHLYSLFGDWELALASYNCGEGRVIRTIAKQGTKDFWKLRLPRQTRDYVPKYMACLALARDAERYGLHEVERAERLAFDVVAMPGPVDVKAVAEACEVELDSLRFLNPALRKNVAPPSAAGLARLRVPAGFGETLHAGLARGSIELPRMAALPREPEYIRHRVRRGETLGKIARRYRVPLATLARTNRISTRSIIRIGQVLRVPRGLDRQLASASRAPARARAYSGTKSIRIRRGDTLIELARKFGTDVATLRALNGLRPRQHIRAGGILKVPVP